MFRCLNMDFLGSKLIPVGKNYWRSVQEYFQRLYFDQLIRLHELWSNWVQQHPNTSWSKVEMRTGPVICMRCRSSIFKNKMELDDFTHKYHFCASYQLYKKCENYLTFFSVIFKWAYARISNIWCSIQNTFPIVFTRIFAVTNIHLKQQTKINQWTSGLPFHKIRNFIGITELLISDHTALWLTYFTRFSHSSIFDVVSNFRDVK